MAGMARGRFNEALSTLIIPISTYANGIRHAGLLCPHGQVDQRIQESIKGMTGGALGLAMAVGRRAVPWFRREQTHRTSSEVEGSSF